MTQKYQSFIKLQRTFFIKRDTYNNSLWLQKYINKLMVSGKKYLIDKHLEEAFIKLKFNFKKLPIGLFAEHVKNFRPVLSVALKRMGRKYNPVPIPIQYRRQYIISLTNIVIYTKTIGSRNFSKCIEEALEAIFESKRNTITKAIAAYAKFLAEARFYTHLRWR